MNKLNIDYLVCSTEPGSDKDFMGKCCKCKTPVFSRDDAKFLPVVNVKEKICMNCFLIEANRNSKKEVNNGAN